MDKAIHDKLQELEKTVRSGKYKKEAGAVKEWGGADVIIKKELDDMTQCWLVDQHLVISYQKTAPKKRAVITAYSQELSWLFYELKGIFQGKIDYISKYDFFGSLAQSALDYLDVHQDGGDCESLLFAVIETSKGFEVYDS